jgi:hypothetical protein
MIGFRPSLLCAGALRRARAPAGQRPVSITTIPPASWQARLKGLLPQLKALRREHGRALHEADETFMRLSRELPVKLRALEMQANNESPMKVVSSDALVERRASLRKTPLPSGPTAAKPARSLLGAESKVVRPADLQLRRASLRVALPAQAGAAIAKGVVGPSAPAPSQVHPK